MYTIIVYVNKEYIKKIDTQHWRIEGGGKGALPPSP